ncbi:MAG TPA: hypothetical protein VFV54_00835 [Thermoanaerobaculia bacterium]|nr:hypothetical protein [Thermoanaerobaculia bacterium]
MTTASRGSRSWIVTRSLSAALAACLLFAPGASGAALRFRDDFDRVAKDPAGKAGWRFRTGEGAATMDLVQGGPGYASILVDATADERNVWWAFIQRDVDVPLDLALLAKPGFEVRIEARIRASHAPRRVNLQVQTQRTTDYHSHLMEFDIPDTAGWHTISMTTRDFDAVPGDALIAHMALMDWGRSQFRVDVDYVEVRIVDVNAAGPDRGEAVPYHPPIADPAAFEHAVGVAHDATIDLANRKVNLNDWSVREKSAILPLLAVDGSRIAVLRWDLSAFAGKKVAGSGLLLLTTRSVHRKAENVADFGLLRVVEVLSGDPAWNEETVTAESFLRGEPLHRALNPQMIIDWPAAAGEGATTLLTIPRPVLQRLVDGTARGIALTPLGAVSAAFYAREAGEGRGPRLLFDLE